MSTPFRMTIPTQRVLAVLLADQGKEHHGYDIARQAGLASGTVHPILARLEDAGWVSSRWEQIDESDAGRRARRYYAMTDAGVSGARAALAKVRPAPVAERSHVARSSGLATILSPAILDSANPNPIEVSS